jgi:hypothetical protein
LLGLPVSNPGDAFGNPGSHIVNDGLAPRLLNTSFYFSSDLYPELSRNSDRRSIYLIFNKAVRPYTTPTYTTDITSNIAYNNISTYYLSGDVLRRDAWGDVFNSILIGRALYTQGTMRDDYPVNWTIVEEGYVNGSTIYGGTGEYYVKIQFAAPVSPAKFDSEQVTINYFSNLGTHIRDSAGNRLGSGNFTDNVFAGVRFP